MKKFLLCVVMFFLAMFSAGCGNTGSAPQVTTIVLTSAPLPTYTLYPTYTYYPTYTQLPTSPPATSTLTPSPTKTATPTNTATPTYLPATSTAAAKTESAASTITAKTLAAINTASAKTEIAATTAAAKTQTSAVKTADAAYLAEFTNIDYRELRDYANKHKGEKVCVRGRVFNVVSDKILQMYFAGTSDALYVEFLSPFSGIYERNSIEVCGTVFGTYSFKNTYGNTITQPALWMAFIPNR